MLRECISNGLPRVDCLTAPSFALPSTGAYRCGMSAPFEDVRAAYLAKAKTYHPDRYANADLPDEVKRYLENMACRINVAFSALEEPHQQGRQNAVHRLAPVYSSPERTG